MTCETFRYCWIKVTDEDGRAATMRSALELQSELMKRAGDAAPGSADAEFVKEQVRMARSYLGELVDHGVRVVVYPQDAALTLHVLGETPHTVSDDGTEIAIADMPAGYTRERALAWIGTPVGSAWRQGALACRLIYAVATTEEDQRMVAPQVRAQDAEQACSTSS